MNRRDFLRRAGAAATVTLAGCLGGDGTPTEPAETASPTGAPDTTTGGATTGTASPTPHGTLTVATYSSFTGEGTAGTWLKGQFEAEYPGVTVEFVTPQSGLNQYIQRAQQGAPIDADLYVGLNTGELVRADRELDQDLFAVVEDELDRADTVKEALRIDPDGRAIPYDTGYISLVYNAHEVENPGTFDALLEPAYENALITENAQQSDPGRAFLLWTIINEGAEGYLDYWQGLLENGVTIMSDWEPAYNAYLAGEAPIVVSYSTDQVYYHGEGVDMQKHQVGFLNDQGYANPEAMALFAASDQPALGKRFMEFVLRPESQAGIAVRNVQFPAVEGVDPGEEFSKYAYEPPEPVTFTYEELAGNVTEWVDAWARQVASK
ncbi:MAG: thiamine ABC transporter substrate binding subunit [Halobacteriales archaeon]